MDNPTRKRVITAYQTGRSSIQDIARVHKVDVSEVLDAVGEGNLSTVNMPGDLISESEAGPNAKMNYGKTESIKFSVN